MYSVTLFTGPLDSDRVGTRLTEEIVCEFLELEIDGKPVFVEFDWLRENFHLISEINKLDATEFGKIKDLVEATAQGSAAGNFRFGSQEADSERFKRLLLGFQAGKEVEPEIRGRASISRKIGV